VRPELFERLKSADGAGQAYLFASTGARKILSRFFFPDNGAVLEDPATGSACAALGGCLAAGDARADGDFRWLVEQGVAMGRPSLIEVEAEKRGGRVAAVRVAGHAVIVADGVLTL
jgi:trans-2,3-dihydro-3-hydroxyanthranilate isomerase